MTAENALAQTFGEVYSNPTTVPLTSDAKAQESDGDTDWDSEEEFAAL